MRIERGLFLVAGLVLASAGCHSSAHFIERSPTGGTIAVPDYQHRGQGLDLLHEEVGPNVRIVDEKTVETGAEQKTVTQVGGGGFFTRIASWFTGVKEVAKTDTKVVKTSEWRITYEVIPSATVPKAVHP